MNGHFAAPSTRVPFIRGLAPPLSGDPLMIGSKPYSRSRAGRRLSWLLAAAMTVAALFAPASVLGHTPNVSLTCQGGLVVNLTAYNSGGTNTAAVKIDNVAVAGSPFTFGSSYSHTFAVTPPTVAHTANVAI